MGRIQQAVPSIDTLFSEFGGGTYTDWRPTRHLFHRSAEQLGLLLAIGTVVVTERINPQLRQTSFGPRWYAFRVIIEPTIIGGRALKPAFDPTCQAIDRGLSPPRFLK